MNHADKSNSVITLDDIKNHVKPGLAAALEQELAPWLPAGTLPTSEEIARIEAVTVAVVTYYVNGTPTQGQEYAWQVICEKFASLGINPVPVGYRLWPGLTTEGWFRQAKPNPGPEDLNVQMGVHVEEFVEMLDACLYWNGDEPFDLDDVKVKLTALATQLKTGKAQVEVHNPEEFADSLFDQRVTGEGLGYMQGVPMAEGNYAVVLANFSKFENGVPIYKAGGKIDKGCFFVKPDMKWYTNPAAKMAG